MSILLSSTGLPLLTSTGLPGTAAPPADVTAPILSSVVDTQTGSTTATWGVTSDEANGIIYAAARLSASGTLTKAEIENGTGNAVATSFDSSPTADSSNGGILSGLSASTAYTVDVFQRDAAGNESSVVSGDGFTTASDTSQSGIAHAATLTHRNSLASDHYTANAAVQNENTYMGITDEAGFTTYTASTASQIKTIIEARGVNDEFIIELDWDGNSIVSNSTINCISVSGLSSNGAVDWGYDRPDWACIIRPASGRSPIISPPSSPGVALSFRGASRIHIEGASLTIKGGIEFEARPAFAGSYTVPAMAFCKDFTIQDETSGAAIDMGSARVVHLENVTSINNRTFCNRNPNYFRAWGCKIKNHGPADYFSLRGYSATNNWVDDWTSHIWIAGLFSIGTTPTDSSTHQDGIQITQSGQYGPSGGGTQDYLGTKQLIEYCWINVDSGGSGGQGIFGDDPANNPGTFRLDYLVHNTIIIAAGANGHVQYDPSDNGEKRFYRNMMMFGGNALPNQLIYDSVTQHPQVGEVLSSGGFSGTVSSVNTTAKTCILTGVSGTTSNNASISGNMGASCLVNMPNNRPKILTGPGPTQTGSGLWDIRDNYYNDSNSLAGSGYSNQTITNTVTLDPSNAASVLTGDASWGTDIVGDVIYTQPERGATVLGDGTYDLDEAYTLCRAFYTPAVGWSGGGGGSYGPIDPNTWPSAGQETLSLGT